MNLLVKNITIVILISFYSTLLKAQHKNDTISDWDRTFMPAIQMGYVGHGTDQLSGGLMIQTSLEYRHNSNFVLRVNYDDFDSNMKIKYPLNPALNFSGRMSFFELIGGIGYRDRDGKHNFTGYIEGGIRNYGYPVFTTDSIQANLDFDSRNIGIMRYTIGYEFALAPKLFLTLEALISHTLESKDFWIDNRWSYGATLGITTPLF
jgi:hypothetical protein